MECVLRPQKGNGKNVLIEYILGFQECCKRVSLIWVYVETIGCEWECQLRSGENYNHLNFAASTRQRNSAVTTHSHLSSLGFWKLLYPGLLTCASRVGGVCKDGTYQHLCFQGELQLAPAPPANALD